MKTYFMTMIDGTDDWVVYEPDYTIIDSRATRGMDSAMDFSRVMSGNGTAYSTYVLSAHPDTIRWKPCAERWRCERTVRDASRLQPIPS